jgi:hypothetical protein
MFDFTYNRMIQHVCSGLIECNEDPVTHQQWYGSIRYGFPNQSTNYACTGRTMDARSNA